MDTAINIAASASRPFVITRTLAHVSSVVILAAVLIGIHLLMRAVSPETSRAPISNDEPHVIARRRRGIKALIVGADGRASTSKTQVVMWTLAVVYALLFMLLWGRSIGCHKPSAAQGDVCAAASQARDFFAAFIDRGLQPAYYVLLGFPLAAALAAKAMTQAKVADKTLVKDPLPEGYKGGFTTGLAEIVSNDSGESDLMDFQYFLFNLVTLGFFLLEFVPNPGNGLPDLPGTLLSLSGLSTAAYTTKKALEATPTAEDEDGGDEGKASAGRAAPGRKKP